MCNDENSVQFDFRNPGTKNGLPSVIERKKDDLTLILKGWTGMRNYAGGYFRGDSGTAFVEVTGLQPRVTRKIKKTRYLKCIFSDFGYSIFDFFR